METKELFRCEACGMIGRLDQCCDGAIVNEWCKGQGYDIQDGCITLNGEIHQYLTSMNRWADRNKHGIAPSRLALAMAVSRETVIDLEHGRATWTFELGRKHVCGLCLQEVQDRA